MKWAKLENTIMIKIEVKVKGEIRRQNRVSHIMQFWF